MSRFTRRPHRRRPGSRGPAERPRRRGRGIDGRLPTSWSRRQIAGLRWLALLLAAWSIWTVWSR